VASRESSPTCTSTCLTPTFSAQAVRAVAISVIPHETLLMATAPPRQRFLRQRVIPSAPISVRTNHGRKRERAWLSASVRRQMATVAMCSFPYSNTLSC
jgi:hypothetical protein